MKNTEKMYEFSIYENGVLWKQGGEELFSDSELETEAKAKVDNILTNGGNMALFTKLPEDADSTMLISIQQVNRKMTIELNLDHPEANEVLEDMLS